MLSEYVKSTLVRKRLSSTAPFHCRFERIARGDSKCLSNSVTFGAPLANGVPAAPFAHCVGMEWTLARYVVQAGVGAAAPTHMSCCTPLGNPVLSSAEPIDCALGVLWKMPTPPRMTARGPRTAPSNAPTWPAVPYVQENPIRGLR